MSHQDPSETPFLTATEEIEKRYREGRPFNVAVESVVSRRLREVTRHCGSEAGPALEAAHDIADSAFRGTLRFGNPPVLSACSIQRGMARSVGLLEESEAGAVLSSAARAILARAWRSSIDKVSLAIHLVLGTVQGARQLETNPASSAAAVAWGLVDLATERDPRAARRIRKAIRRTLEGARIPWMGRMPALHHPSPRRHR